MSVDVLYGFAGMAFAVKFERECEPNTLHFLLYFCSILALFLLEGILSARFETKKAASSAPS
jgi:hypothetical protein